MRTIAILNLKGGSAKTTTAINLSAILAVEHGQRVLLVDADSQANVTKNLLPPGEYDGMYGLLLGESGYLYDCVIQSSIRGLDVLPSDFRLATVGLPYVQMGRYSQRALVDLRDGVAEDLAYDYLIIDCPSSFVHPGCQSALLAAESVIIPVQADAYGISAAEELAQQVECLRAINPELRVEGCLLTKCVREPYVESAIQSFRREAPVHVFDTQIRYSTKAFGSTEDPGSILAYSPRSAIAQDYRAFVAELTGGAHHD